MGVWRRGPAKNASAAGTAVADDLVIDVRGTEARTFRVNPPSPYGYDAVVPPAWQNTRKTKSAPRPSEHPPPSELALPRRFRLDRRFPPLQRAVHHGPVDGQSVEIKLTVANSIRLHSTGIEHSLRDLEGRLSEKDHLKLLIDAFGRDHRLFGSQITRAPRTLIGAKREWYKSIASGRRYGFALNDRHLVLLQYLPPDRDLRQRDFGIAYKRIVVAYRITINDTERHHPQRYQAGSVDRSPLPISAVRSGIR